MTSQALKSKKATRCMECGRTIPAGMTFRKIHDKRGLPIGDHCYAKCKPVAPKKVYACTKCGGFVSEGDEIAIRGWIFCKSCAPQVQGETTIRSFLGEEVNLKDVVQ